MKEHDVTEQAFKNGYEKGYTEGYNAGYRKERQGEWIAKFVERLSIKMMCNPQISRVIYEKVLSLAKEITEEMKGAE